jgi:hyperosmotically inducible periplasmic protein
MRKLIFISGAVLLFALGAWAQQDSNPSQPAPADNTTVNQGDRNSANPTADQQKENQPDRVVTQQIRHALVNDKSLSTYGHNVKIITQGGMVTLRGPVRSDDEKQAIEAKAKEIAGADKVTDDLEVAPKQ